MRTVLLPLLVVVACGDSGSEPHTPADGGRDAAPVLRDAGSPPPTPTGMFPAHSGMLPFAYTRPDVGTPVDAAELTRVTDRYLDLLERTHFLDLVEERAHGWPESA